MGSGLAGMMALGGIGAKGNSWMGYVVRVGEVFFFFFSSGILFYFMPCHEQIPDSHVAFFILLLSL
jgi:hypothetical protein